MMGSSVPMSPDSLSPVGKPPYYTYKPRPGEEPNRGRRPSGHGASGKRSKVM
ncbi:hypothetical protein KUTeg_002862 [Tegillarca granosa]|uniref:Uncharacterized protein n=1 Tax=Tegillarca granosa TaxID=220873 RepID=A0ABQ9FTG4_TEGGR|nr:hypothetical protein KUTeg_002862 [Tegillarca granosa]